MNPSRIAVFGDLNLDTAVHIARFPVDLGDTTFSIDMEERRLGHAHGWAP